MLVVVCSGGIGVGGVRICGGFFFFFFLVFVVVVVVVFVFVFVFVSMNLRNKYSQTYEL